MTTSSAILQTLSSDSFVAVNKRLLRFCEGDATAALLLSELLAMYRYHRDKGALDIITQAFPASMRYIEKALGLTPFKQQRSLKFLQDKQLIVSFMQGMPAKRWVSINFDAIVAIFAEEEKQASQTTSFYEQLSVAAQTNNAVEILSAAGNMSTILANMVLLISMQHIPKKIWTPKMVGMLKYILSFYNKGGAVGFDYMRVHTLITTCLPTNPASLEELVFSMVKTYKGVQETPPQERKYDVFTTPLFTTNTGA